MVLGNPGRAGTVPTGHDAIKKIGRLVQLCAGVLLLSAILLVGTALQVMQSIDSADLANERQRAANAIDAMVAAYGPLTAERAALLADLAGLRDARLAEAMPVEGDMQQIPLLAGQGPSGSFLTWTRSRLAEGIFRQFAPIRLPIIGIMMVVVFSVLLVMRKLVLDIDRQRRIAHLQSRSDPLTGLANRLALDAALNQSSAAGAPFAVLVLDLDHFKDINDAFGHAAGDEVLRGVAARLSRLLGPDDLLARVGGDEFVIVCISRTGPTALAQLAQDCIAAVERPIPLADRSVQVGVSLGILPAESWKQAPESLIAMADAALYRAKSQRGSTFQFSAPERAETPSTQPLARSA